MSTSSALASAKRRRAANLNQPGSGNNQMPEPEQEPGPEQKPKFTPIQLLQLHELRIKKLEMLLSENTSADVYNNNNNNNNNNKEDLERHVEKSLADMKKTIDNKSILSRLDIDELIDSKLSNSHSSLSKNDINQIIDSKVVDINDKVNTLVNDLKELDTFKTMLIKNQSDIIDNNKMLNVVSMKINNLITDTICNDNDGNNNDNDNDCNIDDSNDENETLDMTEIINLFKQMNGGEELIEKFMEGNNDTESINIENEELHVLDSIINIETCNDCSDACKKTLSRDAIIENISDNIIKRIDISDDDEESDIKLFKNISEKIKEEISEEISEETREQMGVKKHTEAVNDTHHILEEDAHAVV